MGEQLRVGISLRQSFDDEDLELAAQFGTPDVRINTPSLPGDGRWDFRDLLLLRTRCEDAGLRLRVIENVPRAWLLKAQLGQPGRDEQIENYQATIRAMGRAGIPILGYGWAPGGVWRTSHTTRTRGGALVTSFDHELASRSPLMYDREYSEDEIWQNYAYFIKAVVPVAEEAGVKLALHPSDPPVPALGGVARILRSPEAFERALSIAPSPMSGLDFCQGSWAEMGIDVLEAIRTFGSRGKIFYVHFRNVKGAVPKFEESFVGDGDVDMLAAIRAYADVGFRGLLFEDHVPHVAGDTEWGHRSRAYAIGYIQALIHAVQAPGDRR